MKIRVLDPVEEDLLQAAIRLEEARPGYGDRLLGQYRRAIELLERYPRLHALVDDGITGREFRDVLLRRLKYRIVYELRESELLIVAVLHTSRDEKLWHPRLGDELP